MQPKIRRSASTSEPSELKIALENRAFEIQLFWQRSNYFSVLITALGAATFALKDPFYALIAAIFALAASYLWLMTNLGSKFWQESWETEVTELARKQKITSFVRQTDEIKRRVEVALSVPNKGIARRFVDKLILSKPSVTYHMILLSMVSCFVWATVSVVQVHRWKPKLISDICLANGGIIKLTDTQCMRLKF